MKIPDKTIFEIGHISDTRGISGEHWMGNLSNLLRQLPIMYLCIPGTLNSTLYAMDATLENKYQNSNILSQLHNGIRYFQISPYFVKKRNAKSNSELWMCDKTLRFADILTHINLFAIVHPKEVIFIELHLPVEGELECINFVLQRLKSCLFTKKDYTNNNPWIKISLNTICNTQKNIILLNDKYSNSHDSVFPKCSKFIKTCSPKFLDGILNMAGKSICSTFRTTARPFGIQLQWQTPRPSSYCSLLAMCKKRRDFHENVALCHQNLIEYVVDSNTSVENLNKLFIICVEFECYIDLLYLCMQIMDKRFFQ